MKKTVKIIALLSFMFTSSMALAADVVPPEIKQPGTQPNEVGNLESPDKCDNCHGGYDINAEPAFNWRGSAMGNAGRDPIFWATLAIAEQDFDGAGNLCIRCHSTGGWYGGRSTPTDGSGLAAGDSDGVDCDTCHKITNTDNSEHLGEMFPPFIANVDDSTIPSSEGYYGSGILSLWGGNEKLGPYLQDDARARHQRMQSEFHRDVDFCGSCHDVSNPAVGDLALNNGTQTTADPVISSGGIIGDPFEAKAAFNNPPYMYGIVERTFSEFKASAFDTLLVSDFNSLPAELQKTGGSLEVSYQAALVAGTNGDYANTSPAKRYFSCQTCHLRPTVGAGCNKRGAPIRDDMPKHDMTGGNYWIGPLIKYQDSNGLLRLGDGLSTIQSAAIDAGQVRAGEHLNQAASLEVNGNVLKVINLTGHKLISGYPEGRRMWLNIKWYDANDQLVREDGAYGPIGATVQNPAGGSDVQVNSIIDLDDPNTKIYEAHYAVTKDWAATIRTLHGGAFPLSYDRITGKVDCTVGQLLSTNGCGTGHPDYHETFHFVLNNHVAKDNRIPPYGMSYDEARVRNALPVPADQYGGSGAGSIYYHWDDFTLNPPTGATYATIDLLYQGTSWEYIQFLYLANNGQNAFLGQEGVNMLDAWLNNNDPKGPMVPPYVMASTTWGCTPTGVSETFCNGIDDDCDDLIDEDYVPTATSCGLGVCASFGKTTCVGGVESDTCTPGLPTESPETTCDDILDNDCDGQSDSADSDCQQTITCTDYTNKTDCRNAGCTWSNSTKTCQ